MFSGPLWKEARCARTKTLTRRSQAPRKYRRHSTTPKATPFAQARGRGRRREYAPAPDAWSPVIDVAPLKVTPFAQWRGRRAAPSFLGAARRLIAGSRRVSMSC